MGNQAELITTVGDLGYASPFFAFILFGLFSLALQGLTWVKFFPFPINIFALFTACLCAVLQWAVLIADVMKYEAPWYYGLLDPFRILLDGQVWSRFGFIFGMALPAIGIIAVTFSALLVALMRSNDLIPEHLRKQPNGD